MAHKDKERAILAQQILDNPIYQEAVSEVENRLVQAWQDTIVSQREDRE